ncbi:leucine-rich repeat protein, partial [Chryseobacterium sp.]|uniref:leucine-rich repeat protein n=1 Tax=Chryseobacterium sp. TaxID=1871047 RepID=UPI0025B9C880
MKAKTYYLVFLFFLLGWTTTWAQISKEYDVSTPGSLSQLMGTDKNTITDLILTGTLNSTDFQTIKGMTVLKNLDLENVHLEDDLLPAGAFQGKTLSKITLPVSLKSIGISAFQNATFDEIDFSKSPDLSQINQAAFKDAKVKPNNTLNFSQNLKLSDFTTTQWLTGTFSGYAGKVILPPNLKTVPTCTFAGFKGEVILPNTVENIGSAAFYNATPTLLKLSANLKYIDQNAFDHATISELDFTNSPELTTMTMAVFNNANIPQIDLSKNLKLSDFSTTQWPTGTFSGYAGKVILPPNLKTIPELAFAAFKGEVIIPDSIEKIGVAAFYNAAPTMIKLSKNLITIERSAFERATITELDFSNSLELTSIGTSAFNSANIPQVDFSKNLKLTEFPSTINLAGTFSQYAGKVILPPNLKTIPELAFAAFKGEVVIPNSVEEIGTAAFYNSAPTLLKLSTNLKIIAKSSFERININGLDFSNCLELTSIGVMSFQNATVPQLDFSKNLKLTEFPLIQTIAGAFTGYAGKVILPTNLKVISTYTFASFKGEVVIPNSVEEIGAAAFYNSASTLLKLSTNLKIIAKSSFERININGLDFSNCLELTSIGVMSFQNATVPQLDFSKNLKLTEFPLIQTIVGAFTGYAGKVILPTNLKVISTYTFASFKGEVSIPNTVEEIGAAAFYKSTIKETILPSALNQIGTSAFDGCTSLVKIISHNPTPPQLGINIFKGIDLQKVQLCVPKESTSIYQATNQWNDFPNYCEAINTSELAIYAPNSYIFDIDKAKDNNYGGLEIPVAKAYAMWSKNEYLDKQSIPSGILSASVYWQDVEGLIQSASVNQNGENSKINVRINKAKGKGNALIALHVGSTGNPQTDPVYWSWHIWVTDDPTKSAIAYKNNAPGVDWTNTFMDRNLGASSNTFLGYGWNKTGGLLYQWGRKDPFPPMIDKDGALPIISTQLFGDITLTNHSSIFVIRPNDEMNGNIKYATQNPLKFINGATDSELWFSKEKHNSGMRFDLWSDNTEGKQNVVSYQNQLKSPFDPCPSGWRVPSYAHGLTGHPKYSPWGNSYNVPADGVGGETISGKNNRYPSAKIYPGLGFDFVQGEENYHIGQYALTGHYVKYPSGKSYYQDQGSEGFLWGASMDIFGIARGMHIISDPTQALGDDSTQRKGWYHIDTYSGSGAVRCSKDPRGSEIDWFVTQYLPAEVKDYTEGLENPNSYLLVKSSQAQSVTIPVNKAYAVYNQYLTEHDWPKANETQSVNVYWTTDTGLLTNVALNGSNENGSIQVTVAPNKSGNAVVSLHSGINGNSSDPVLWSWHIWVPNNNPIENPVTYTTEKRFSDTKPAEHKDFLMFSTRSGLIPLTTTFMDRNLGALEFDVASDNPSIYGKTGGIHYQWGRKDPIPTFQNVSGVDGYPGDYNYSIYLGSNTTGSITYQSINGASYVQSFTQYANFTETPTVMSALKKASENPLLFTYRPNGARNWLPKSMPELWGHAVEKSAFDPCPEGWRVPDQGIGAVNSPWFKEGTYAYECTWAGGSCSPAWGPKSPENFATYKGTMIRIGNTEEARGWAFNDPEYRIGQIPTTGIRGFTPNGNYGGSVYYPKVFGGLWSATMSDNQTGTALGLSFAKGAYEGYNGMRPAEQMNPYWGVPVRCSKDQPRFTADLIANPPMMQSLAKALAKNIEILENKSVESIKSQIQISPNPTTGIFTVYLTEIPEGTIYVTNITGQTIINKTFKNESMIELNIASQLSGVYMVTVISGGTMFKKN